MNEENIYWLFSASAQSIAAFIGLLTAGIFFVFNKLDVHKEQDETLEPVINEIKKIHFQRLKILFVFTSSAILTSLLILYLNDSAYPFIKYLIILSSGLIVITILWAVFFIVTIIDPEKFRKTIDKLIKADKRINTPIGSESMKIQDFLEKFVQLESATRGVLKKNKVYSDNETTIKPNFRLVDMFILLLQMEKIDQETLSDLTELNRIRNLAVHGQIQRIDVKYNAMLDKAISSISNL